jgi:radical SAM protein with 4Fe4S-binding SPASM domain
MKQIDSHIFMAEVSSRAAGLRQPEGVTFELTYGCNLRCVHCFNPTHRALPHELSTAEILAILDQLAELGVLTVTFTGGELSIRTDLAEILRHARNQGLLIRLLTNATRVTSDLTTLLQEVGTEQICVSIYGATAPTYERMTATPGSYALFRQGLTLLASVNIPVIVRMPVTTINSHEIHACQNLAEGLGFKFQYCFDLTPTVAGNVTPLQYRLAPEMKIRLDQEMLPEWGSAPIETACSTTASFIECACGQNRFAITPYGEMNLCTAFPIPRYNLRTGTVKEGWEVLKHTVDEAQSNHRYECPTCDVRPHCRQGRNDAWLETGDMSSCLPHYKQWAQLEHRTYALLDPRRPR